MPEYGKDSKGHYIRFGKSKYYYKKGDKASRARALAKVKKQERAARASGWKG